jgi:hypothetical protein
MLTKILQLLSLSCRHNRTTKPFASAAAVAAAGASAAGQWESVGSGPSHYVVCLDCGRKFAYDWSNMRVIR